MSSEIVETIANIAELSQNPRRERRNLKNVILAFAGGAVHGNGKKKVPENKKIKRKIQDNCTVKNK